MCTALEYFHYQDRQARWGFGNPLDEYAAEVLDRARWVLRGTPLPEARGQDRASALWAIQNHAEAADAPLITAALRAVNGDVVDDGARLTREVFTALRPLVRGPGDSRRGRSDGTCTDEAGQLHWQERGFGGRRV